MPQEQISQTTERSPDRGPIIEGIDVYDPDVYLARGIPHEDFTRLRAESPVYFHPETGGRGFWVLTKYEDVVKASTNPKLFSSSIGGTNIEDYEGDDLYAIRQLMINMDPPQHHKFRRLVRTGFTPRMVRAMEPKVRNRVKEILDRISPWGECDFVREVAAELPLQVIAELIGVPQEERSLVFDWTNRLIGFDDPEFQTSIEDARIAAMEVWGYANNLVETRRGTEGDDLVRILMNAEIEGEKLTEMEFDAFFLLLSVAGNETTRNALSQGLLTLSQHPEQYEALKANPEELLPGAIDEILRWVSPVIYFRRTVTEDMELRGKQLKAGDKVCVFYGSANRDEDVFDNPLEFDITRTPNDHLSFGIGEHFCLGASLARMEMQVLFEELFKRMPDIRITGEPVRLRSNFIHGLKSLPVAYTPGG